MHIGALTPAWPPLPDMPDTPTPEAPETPAPERLPPETPAPDVPETPTPEAPETKVPEPPTLPGAPPAAVLPAVVLGIPGDLEPPVLALVPALLATGFIGAASAPLVCCCPGACSFVRRGALSQP